MVTVNAESSGLAPIVAVGLPAGQDRAVYDRCKGRVLLPEVFAGMAERLEGERLPDKFIRFIGYPPPRPFLTGMPMAATPLNFGSYV